MAAGLRSLMGLASKLEEDDWWRRDEQLPPEDDEVAIEPAAWSARSLPLIDTDTKEEDSWQ